MPCNFITMAKTYQQINERIKNGEAVVLTAEEVSQLALTMSPEEIADKVDVVTTGTFGAMCLTCITYEKTAASSTSDTPTRPSAWNASNSTVWA